MGGECWLGLLKCCKYNMIVYYQTGDSESFVVCIGTPAMIDLGVNAPLPPPSPCNKTQTL